MADNVFNIKITAVDNATKIVNKVNKSVSQIFRPYDNAKKSTKSFFDALGKNDLISRPLAGFNQLGGAIGNIGTSFGIAESSVLSGSSRIAASLGAIGGPIGGLLATTAAVAGGTVAVAVKMGQLGFNVEQVAKNIGVTTDNLQAYRGAAKLAGLTTESMDSSLGNLGATLQDASAGRNNQVTALLTQMGVSIKRTKDGAVDTVQAYRDIADVISKITDPNIAKKMTDMLGLTESLPLIRQGTTALDGFLETAKRTGSVMSDEMIKKNKAQADSWNQITAAIDGMGISTGNAIAKLINLSSIADTVTKAASRDAGATPKPGFSLSRAFAPAMGAITMGPYGVYQAIKDQLSDSNGGKSRESSGRLVDMTSSPTIAGNQALPRGLRNNNPGNLRSWPCAGSSGGYAAFASPEDGLKAAGRNLIAYQDKYGIDTISKTISRWAPAGDNNNVPAYIAAMSKSTGYGADQNLNFHDPKVLAPMISGLVKHENGQNPYDAETIAKAAVAAVREAQGGGDGGADKGISLVVHNVPAGMSVKAMRGLGQSTVGLTMAPGGAS
jgi:hypothetical protein